jgi:glyoxylase-like metal-dependent hydrolase (beta-lactamase superfamily II)
MQIKFLGTGGAFDYEYGNSAAWLMWRGQRILIDCGNTVYAALRQSGLASHIDHLLVTHFHDDHVGSLCSTILHHKYFLRPERKASLLVPSLDFQEQLYDFISFALIKPEDFVTFTLLDEMPGIRAIDTKDLHISGMQSYGFVFEDEHEVLAYSGDLGDPNVIFGELLPHREKPTRVFHEISFEPSTGVHTSYQDLKPHLAHYDIWGYHIDPRRNPADNDIPLVAHSPELLAPGVRLHQPKPQP